MDIMTLSREFFSQELKTPHELSKCEAWIDLVLSAHADNTAQTVRIGRKAIEYSFGQYVCSIRWLAERWMWGEMKVRTFLGHLEGVNMITLKRYNTASVITICGYGDVVGKKTKTKRVPKNTVNNTVNNTVTPFTNGESDVSYNTVNDTVNDTPKDLTNVDAGYAKFCTWIKENAPYCSKNIPLQITQEQFLKLKTNYSSKQIAEVILQIENRKDLRKKYVNLYLTALNWLKRNNQNNGNKGDSRTQEERLDSAARLVESLLNADG